VVTEWTTLDAPPPPMNLVKHDHFGLRYEESSGTILVSKVLARDQQ